MPKNLTFVEGVGRTTPFLGLGNTGARGFKPHSDKTQVAIEDQGCVGWMVRLRKINKMIGEAEKNAKGLEPEAKYLGLNTYEIGPIILKLKNNKFVWEIEHLVG